VQLKNMGKIPGAETVQVYIRDEVSSVMTPTKKLVAFKKVCLDAGEEITVEISLSLNDFALVNTECETVVEPGEFTVFIGHSSKDEDLLPTTFVYGG